uniref:Uncharacterized protein n=1 Tax=Aegilops tauschii subsp. strangulata TaxID=200361 RepID=A0A453AXB4_AEGTS
MNSVADMLFWSNIPTLPEVLTFVVGNTSTILLHCARYGCMLEIVVLDRIYDIYTACWMLL